MDGSSKSHRLRSLQCTRRYRKSHLGDCVSDSYQYFELLHKSVEARYQILLICPGIGNTGDSVGDTSDEGLSEPLRRCLGLLYGMTRNNRCRFLHYPDRKLASTGISLLIN